MYWILLIIGVALVVYIKSLADDKIDADEKKALSTPGRANYLRDNYHEVLSFLENKPNYHVLFERKDMVKIGLQNENEYYAVSNYSGGVMIALVRYSSVVKEWKFVRNELPKHIIYELTKID